jgi:hypothetical protein
MRNELRDLIQTETTPIHRSGDATGIGISSAGRIERLVKIDTRLLDSSDGCGLMLAKIPRYRPDNVFPDVMLRYRLPNVHADKRAARLMEEDESLMRRFCQHADSFGFNLAQNFRTVFAPRGIFLAVDPAQGAAYFLAEPENYLALANFFRDALPAVAGTLGITVKGSTGRLTPAGWRNLLDLCLNTDFRYHCSPVRCIEVMVVTPTTEWRAPNLYIGLSLLNLGGAGTVLEKAIEALTVTDSVTADLDARAPVWAGQTAPQTACHVSAA